MFAILFLFLCTHFCVDIYAQQEPVKRAIVVGASVGMGKALCKMLAQDGYIVGMASRRIELLQELQQEIQEKFSSQTYVVQMDVARQDEAVEKLQNMIVDMGGLDLLVLAPTGFWDCDFDSSNWRDSFPIFAVDCVGFFALARTGLNFFEQQGHGHLVGFSSVDGLKGVASCPAYSASKAFCSRYLEAEYNKYQQQNIPIFVTDICPGFINSRGDLDYTQLPSGYWIETLENAMHDIWQAIKNKERVAYITKRWEKVAQLLSTIPNDLYNALSARPGGGF